MRVIAGNMGGRKLVTPKGTQTRPTPDRVREALFSMLLPHLPDAQVLDLFAGSGALGIEALSRGAGHVTFVEQARAALDALHANRTSLNLAKNEQSLVLPLPVHTALRQLGAQPGQFDLVLLDPPYARNLVPETLRLLIEHNLLAHDGIIVAEHAGKTPSPPCPTQLHCYRHKRYGDVAMSFYSLTFATPSPEKTAP